jgi:hypothetical protein
MELKTNKTLVNILNKRLKGYGESVVSVDNKLEHFVVSNMRENGLVCPVGPDGHRFTHSGMDT